MGEWFGIPVVLGGVAVVFALATVAVGVRVTQPLVDAHLLPTPTA